MNTKIIMYPSKKVSDNRYLNNLYNTIKDTYDVIGYDEAKKLKKLFNGNIYHFNWIEGNNKNNKLNIKIDYLKKKIFITLLKFLNKKIIWTVHNNMPHEVTYEREIIKFMKFMAKKSDKIHILCTETLNNEYLEKYKQKIICIPHGDYIGNYDGNNIDIYKKYNISKERKIILFVGQIRKYKNIELLIKAFKESKIERNNYVLLICGKCNDEIYKKQLKQMINNSIYLDFNFIKDDEMGSYLKTSEVVIAPYNKNSSLNSGTLWMCMSYEKTMILPLIGCIKDIQNYNKILYTYDYENDNAHYNSLLNCLIKVKEDIINNKNILVEKGKNAYKYVLKNQTWKVLKDKWIQLYKF